MEVRERPAVKWKPAALWTLRVVLVLVFLSAGGAKLFGVPMMVENFEKIGAGQWFRYVTGGLEVLGALMLLAPGKSAFGALLLIFIMIGATFTHLFLIGGSAIPAVILLVLAAIVLFAQREQLKEVIG